MRSAKLAAIGGVDYQPPAAMAIQLPPIRKVSRVNCLIGSLAYRWDLDSRWLTGNRNRVCIQSQRP